MLKKLATRLNALQLPGLIFRPIHFSPFYAVFKGTMIHGVQVHISDFARANLTLTQFYVLQECHKLWPDKNIFEMCEPSRLNMFDKVCGSDTIRKTFFKNIYRGHPFGISGCRSNGSFPGETRKYFLYK